MAILRRMSEVHVIELGHDAANLQLHHRSKRILHPSDEEKWSFGLRIGGRSVRIRRLLARVIPLRCSRFRRPARAHGGAVGIEVVALFVGPGVDLLVGQPLAGRFWFRAIGRLVQAGEDDQTAPELGGDHLSAAVGIGQAIVGGRIAHAFKARFPGGQIVCHRGLSFWVKSRRPVPRERTI